MEEERSRMVSDAELIGGIIDFLRSVDLKETTISVVRRKLEGDFGVDLSQRRPFIRQQVEFFLYNHVQEKSDYEPEEDEDEDCGSDSVAEQEENGGGESPAAVEKKLDCKPSASEGSDVGEPVENGCDGGRLVVLEEKLDGGPSHGEGSSRILNNAGNKLVIRSKVCILSPPLKKFLGESIMLRFEVLNRLWEYVSQHKLIDPSDKEKILCDEKLKELFGIDSFKICQMNNHLSKHLIAAGPAAALGAAPAEALAAASPAAKPEEKKKPKKRKRAEAEANGAEKPPKRVVTTGILSPSPISETFINFLGTGETALTRPDAIKKIWGYIKSNNIKKDPLNRRIILCDEKLKELFGVDSFDGFTIPKLIQAHFVKRS